MTATRSSDDMVREATARAKQEDHEFWQGVGGAVAAAVAGLGGAVVLAEAVHEGMMPPTIAYVIVGLVCVWLLAVVATRLKAEHAKTSSEQEGQ